MNPLSKQGLGVYVYHDQVGLFECHGAPGAGSGPRSKASGVLEQAGGQRASSETMGPCSYMGHQTKIILSLLFLLTVMKLAPYKIVIEP